MRAHSPLRPVLGVLALALALAVGSALAGCGSGSETTAPPPSATTSSGAPPGVTVENCSDDLTEPPGVRVAGAASCAEGRATVAAWTRKQACFSPEGASRHSCTVGRYRCIATATDRGIAANCARPGRSISFVIRREAPASAG